MPQGHIRRMGKLYVSMVMTALLVATAAQSQVLKSEPASGNLAAGKRVLVDDGTCPAGQIKHVTGGNNLQNIARSTRCIPYRGRK